MNYPDPMCNLIECFKKLPGVGEKTAERMMLSVMNFNDETIEMFSNSIKDVKNKVKYCEICNNYSDSDICSICRDEKRNGKIICVIEDAKYSILFEKMGSFNGKYHVLNGLISPLDGVGPDDINISKLIDRIDKEQISEIILAVKPSVEGETTSLYISRLLNGKNVKVTKIAHGVPLGADIDYIDTLTLELAIEDRKEIIS